MNIAGSSISHIRAFGLAFQTQGELARGRTSPGVPFGRLRRFEWHAEAVTERRIPSPPSRPTRIVIYVVVLAVALGINYWAAHRIIQETRVRVPYSPFFLEQVRADNVVTVTSI